MIKLVELCVSIGFGFYSRSLVFLFLFSEGPDRLS